MAAHQPSRELNRALGETLRAARLKRGLSPLQLADRMDRLVTFVHQVEKGYRTPTFTTLRRFAKALDTTAWNLLRNAELRLAQAAQPPATSAVEIQPDTHNPAA